MPTQFSPGALAGAAEAGIECCREHHDTTLRVPRLRTPRRLLLRKRRIEHRLLLYCAAGGCKQRDLWAALRKLGLAPDSAEWLARQAELGKRPKRRARDENVPDRDICPAASEAKSDDVDNEQAALAIWRRRQPIPGTLAEHYLRSRGFSGPIPPALCFARCKHPADGRYHPTMVAAVVLEGRMDRGVAIHRTFLKPDGSGKADLDPNKMTLGSSKGGAVPLAPAGPVLAVPEGIETGLSYMQVTGVPTWAGLSTSGIRNLILLAEVGEVILAADPDIPGMRAAREAARRWLAEGRRVRIVRPPLGADFNDLLRSS